MYIYTKAHTLKEKIQKLYKFWFQVHWRTWLHEGSMGFGEVLPQLLGLLSALSPTTSSVSRECCGSDTTFSQLGLSWWTREPGFCARIGKRTWRRVRKDKGLSVQTQEDASSWPFYFSDLWNDELQHLLLHPPNVAALPRHAGVQDREDYL